MNQIQSSSVKEINGISLTMLREFLEANTSPEHITLFIRASDFFRELSIDQDVEEEYEQTLLLQDVSDIDPNTLLETIEHITLKYLYQYLNKVSVTLSDNISLERLLNIVEGIYALEFYENSESLCSILESSEDNEVQLAQCISEVQGLPMEEYLVDIWYASPSLLLKIHELHRIESEYLEEPQDIEKQKFFRDRLREYSKFIKTTNTRVINLIRTGMPYGLPIQTYLTRLQDILQQLPTNNVAVELYSLYLISKEYEENPMTVLEPYIEVIGSDIDKTTQIRSTLLNVIRKSPLSQPKTY